MVQESFNARLKAEGDEGSTNLYLSNLPKRLTETVSHFPALLVAPLLTLGRSSTKSSSITMLSPARSYVTAWATAGVWDLHGGFDTTAVRKPYSHVY